MAPPRNQRGHERTKRKGGGGWKADGRGRRKRDGQSRRGRSKGHESDPDNENLYTEVDRFHMQKDLITFDGADANSEESDDESEQEEAVMNLKGVDGGSSGSGSGSGSSEESEDGDSDVSELPELPEHVQRAAMEAAFSDEDSEDDEDGGKGKFAAGWGKNRSSYYDADTADLEIGQEFEDAEAEEEAALEQQRASYKKLDPADFGEEEEEGDDDDADEDKHGEGKTLAGKKSNGKAGRRVGSGARGAALLEMKSDLERIALGGGEEIMTSMVKKDTAKLSRRDKLERVLSEAPELPSLLAEVKAQLGILTDKVQPLVSNVTADLGASEDGLMYLRTRQQLLLAFCMNVCFYMVLKAKGKSAKGHPVIRRLLSLRALLADMSALDDRMSSQVDLLLRALESGVDLTNAAGDDNSDVEEESGLEENDSVCGEDEGSADDQDGKRGIDEEDLEEEEAAFMGNTREGSEENGEEAEASSSAGAVKKRRRLAMTTGAVEDPSLGDFGDEDASVTSGAGVIRGGGGSGGGGGNILQGMVNRISQRERSLTGKRVGLQGDQDVPFRERDQTIRVRRPVPGEDEGDTAEENGAEQDSDADELGLGGDGFLGGLPADLLDGLSRRKPAGEEKRRGKKGSRDRGGNVGADGEGKVEEDAFYAAVAEQKERKKRAKKEKYTPERRIAGALEAELEAERATRGETKRGASYTIIKNRGLTPHKNKLNRNPRSKKREAFRKATVRRRGQVRDIRTGEADRYGGESTGIKTNVTRSRKLKG